MTALPQSDGADPSDDLMRLIAHGHRILEHERAVLMRGAYHDAAALSVQKSALLTALEEAIAQVRGTDAVRAALTGLVNDSRRNERMIVAARQGIAGARRRIEVIIATGRGRVAYDRDGTPINSRADGVSQSARA